MSLLAFATYCLITTQSQHNHNMVQHCSDCGSDQLIIHAREGDLVCSECGLVNQSRMMIDDMSCVDHVCELAEDKSKDIVFLQERIEFFFGYEACEDIKLCASELFSKAHEKLTTLKSKMKRAIMASSVYMACTMYKRGIDPNNIFTFFDVPLWFNYSMISECWNIPQVQATNGSSDDMIARLVTRHSSIPQEKRNEVVRIAKELRSKTECVMKGSLKSSKVSVCYIYIACKLVTGCKVSKKSIHECYGVSPITLMKHEKLIQELLERD